MIKLQKILSEIQIFGKGKIPFDVFKQKVLEFGLNELIIPGIEDFEEQKKQWTNVINNSQELEDLVDEIGAFGYKNYESYHILIGLLVDLPK